MPSGVIYGLKQTLMKAAPLWEKRGNMAEDGHVRMTVSILEMAEILTGFGHPHFIDKSEPHKDLMILLKIAQGGSVRFRSQTPLKPAP